MTPIATPVVLAVGAHPDDIEFGVAPVLLLERRLDHPVHLAVLSRGEAGTAGTPEQRSAEAETTAARMGASLQWLNCGGDCKLEATPANALLLAELIRRLRPSIVLAPHPSPAQHPDHAAAGKIARDACRLARYGGLDRLAALPPHKIGHLYFYDITQHLDRPPALAVDVSAVVEEWQAVMRLHATQVSARPYVELQLSAARLLGLSVGCEYAIALATEDPIRLSHISDLAWSARAF